MTFNYTKSEQIRTYECTDGLLSELLHDTPKLIRVDQIVQICLKVLLMTLMILLEQKMWDDLILMSNTPEGIQTQLDQLLSIVLTGK